jgi:hypothetical protein
MTSLFRKRFCRNFGEDHALMPRGRRMPTYYFHFRGDRFDLPDLIGRQCDGVEAARAEAELMAAEMLETALLSGRLPPDATIEVDDEEQRPVLALPINRRG